MEDHPERRGRLVIDGRVDGDDIVIAIADNAGGIPEAARENVFDAFFTTKDIGQGTGQGLAISRTIVVDRHGGTLTFETETGVGTTFSIRLPIAGPPAAADIAA
jgi:signal transduction histidine kinase